MAFLPHLSLVLVEPVDVDEDGEDEDDDGDEEGGAAGELVVGPVRRMDIMRELYTCSFLVKSFLYLIRKTRPKQSVPNSWS